MPNWCYNVLYLSHPNTAMVRRVVRAAKEGRLLEEFAPEGKSDYESKLLTLTEAEKLYHKRAKLWGTKWDPRAEDYEIKRTRPGVRMAFETAWAPPVPFYELLERLGFSVRAYWMESGCCFCGKKVNGRVYDLSMKNDKGKRDIHMIPDDILHEIGADKYNVY